MNDIEWLRKRAAEEDGCIVSVGGLVTDIETLGAGSIFRFQECTKEEADKMQVGASILYRICRMTVDTIGFYVALSEGDVYVRKLEGQDGCRTDYRSG